MTWWRRIFGRAQGHSASVIDFPIAAELIPKRLTVHVHSHHLDVGDAQPMPCWSYVTKGLGVHEQKEVIITLPREENCDSYPSEPLDFFRELLALAEQGRLVDVGDVTRLARPELLGRHGVTYISAHQPLDLDAPADALTAILLTGRELDAVEAFGPTRVMSRLGHLYRFYPYPIWSDPARPEMPMARTLNESLLAKTIRLRPRGITVALVDDKQVVMELLPEAGRSVVECLNSVPSNTPLGLLTEIEPTAGGCLVWEPGNTGVSAITRHDGRPSRFCGCFVLLVPEAVVDGVKILEDGFSVTLTAASWKKVREAFETQSEVTIPRSDDSLGFALRWIEQDYRNPVDGGTYHSEQGWRRYRPDGAAKAPPVETGPVALTNIVLLTSEGEMAHRVGVIPLSDYMTAVRRTVSDHFNDPPIESQSSTRELVVQLEVRPGNAVRVAITCEPRLTDDGFEALGGRLYQLPPPEVREGPVMFQLAFSVSKDGEHAERN